MEIITEQVLKILNEGILKAFPQVDVADTQLQFTKDIKFGHMQSNAAMTLAKPLRDNPRSIATKIVDAIDKKDVLESIEIAGPGFINFTISQSKIIEYCNNLFNTEDLFSNLDRAGDIIIDYSSPNIAKRMHIGHLRSTIIGDSLKRIYNYLGYHTVGDNHLGDWGTQFGKLIVAYNQWLDRDAYAKDSVEELERLYVEFEKRSHDKPEMLEEARSELKKLQDGDATQVELWKEFIQASIREYNKIYTRLNVSFDTYYGESHYHPLMPSILDLLKTKGLAKESEGAQVVFFDEEEHLHPCIVQKKDGAYLYATSDLACIKMRMEDYDVNQLIYVTDDRQAPHFKQVFSIASKLDWDVKCEHISFGIMKFKDGHFSSRKGNVIYLKDLLDEAERRAFDVVKEKNPDLPEEEQRDIARIVGVGAVKYADLSQNRSSAIIFDWDKNLSFDGNTAPYLQYVYARIQSIKTKAGIDNISSPKSEIFKEPQEIRLLGQLIQFPSALQKAAESYRPNVVSDYLFDLAQDFNTFYNANRVIVEDQDIKLSRLYLCDLTAKVIKQGLELLGIEVAGRM
ncbi:arginine--tRNA ligase [Spirochaeta cellobiosiphila]|uniref:arginine--tRNA ligase n=1 Tax=Spirochaeta cellobiosiphila TaxID=504483 RepID=UPI0004268705|nr:arginine--tRNA ligase [Spirochaeta cellobiosiphila]